MIKKCYVGSTIVATCEIHASDSSSRRQNERDAVRYILDELAGPDTVLDHTPAGAPIISGSNISISHSRKQAVVAIDPFCKVGIDAEEWRPTLSRVKSKFLSEQELSIFLTDVQLLRAWTIKEAVYKIVGSEAVFFADAIAISPSMESAYCLGRRYSVYPLDIADTFISLVK